MNAEKEEPPNEEDRIEIGAKDRSQATKASKKSYFLEDKFENLWGPVETRHLLISVLLPPALKAFLAECETEVNKLCDDREKPRTKQWATSGDYEMPKA